MCKGRPRDRGDTVRRFGEPAVARTVMTYGFRRPALRAHGLDEPSTRWHGASASGDGGGQHARPGVRGGP